MWQGILSKPTLDWIMHHHQLGVKIMTHEGQNYWIWEVWNMYRLVDIFSSQHQSRSWVWEFCHFHDETSQDQDFYFYLSYFTKFCGIHKLQPVLYVNNTSKTHHEAFVCVAQQNEIKLWFQPPFQKIEKESEEVYKI